MRHRGFSIYDQKAKAYMTPFFMGEVGMATRAFTDMVNSADHMIGKHPEDFVLFEVGQFDDSTGQVTSYDSPELVVSALQVLASVDKRRLDVDSLEQTFLEGVN